MNPNERFIRAVAALPAPVKERLGRDAPLDWSALEESGNGAERSGAQHAYAHLPEAVEALVQRLIRDVGIAPADIAAGAARQASPSAWTRQAAIEPEGEGYRIRDRRSGEVYTNVRPEAVAGYATLALELAAAVHEAGQRWLEAGERLQMADGAEQEGPLARCAAAMCARLNSVPDTVPGRGLTIGVADALELAWNGQNHETRAALSVLRPEAEHGACAPHENPYTPVAGHRLHAYKLGEARWLRALAAEAASGAWASEREETPRRIAETAAAPSSATREDTALADIDTLAERIQAASEENDTLDFGPNPHAPVLEKEMAELAATAKGLPGAIRRRMRDAYGIGLSQTLARLEGSEAGDLMAPGSGASPAGRAAPKWLEELAKPLLADTGVQTRAGLRTGAVRLDPREDADEGYTATEVNTGARGQLTVAALVAQVRLSISFAHAVWTGLTMLLDAGHESDWILKESKAEGRTFTENERATLEAAEQITRALDSRRRAYARIHGDAEPSTAQQAWMAADALAGIDPAARAAAGWPGSAPPPNPRESADIARVTHVAAALQQEIRSIANHLIVGGIAGTLTDRNASAEQVRAMPRKGDA